MVHGAGVVSPRRHAADPDLRNGRGFNRKDAMKYIMFNTSCGVPLFVLFSDQVQHAAIAEKLTGVQAGVPAHPVAIGDPVAAGFAKSTAVGRVLLKGGSASLGLGTTDYATEWARMLLK